VLPHYDIRQSYEWNYQHAPADVPEVEVPSYPGDWDFCGIRVKSPLGVPAGPLLNSRWVLYYAALGFDVLTYKTVRSTCRASFDVPNLLPVAPASLRDEGRTLHAAASGTAYDSWAISFGMPSRHPGEWRADVERARRGLAPGQLLVVSVVASPEMDWNIDDVARDFAQCARWAADAGAHVIEANLSCPNVCTQEADLYLSPKHSEAVAAAVRHAVPELPVVLKIGLLPNRAAAEDLINAVAPYANALSATNSITAKVTDGSELLFGGLRRGIGGSAITARCLQETTMLSDAIKNSDMKLISVGGIATADDVRDRLEAGAHHVQLATAAMIDPLVGVRIRQLATDLARGLPAHQSTR
jgi:dihydroorotate dehydrogenase (NAD+) catalytic subunit